MSTILVTVKQAEDDLDRLIRQAVSGDEVIIEDDPHGRVRLELVSAPAGNRRIGGLPGFVIHMSDDFLEPLDDFEEYMK